MVSPEVQEIRRLVQVKADLQAEVESLKAKLAAAQDNADDAMYEASLRGGGVMRAGLGHENLEEYVDYLEHEVKRLKRTVIEMTNEEVTVAELERLRAVADKWRMRWTAAEDEVERLRAVASAAGVVRDQTRDIGDYPTNQAWEILDVALAALTREEYGPRNYVPPPRI